MLSYFFASILMLTLVNTALAIGCPSNWIEEKTIANKCIVPAETKLSQQDSSFYCKTYGGKATLLSIDNAFENSEIARRLIL